jgi:predicted oxidoreductase
MSEKVEILIVGAGVAGITTALELLDKGHRVTLLDRDLEAEMGGLARWSLGGLFFVDTPTQRRLGIKDSVELAWRDWQAVAEFEEDAYWPMKWARQYVERCTPEVYEWLRGYGVKFLPFVQWLERGWREAGCSLPRFHVTWGSGFGLMEPLLQAFRKYAQTDQLDLRFDHKVTDLLEQNGEVKGVKGELGKGAELFEIAADVTVIASGGISGNEALLKKHWYKDWGAPPEVLLNGGHKYGDGSLHLAAEKAGARLTHLDKIWNYAGGVRYTDGVAPYDGLSLIPAKSGIWVNARGERLDPPLVTGFDTRDMVETICRQEEKYSWLIMNRKIAVKELRVSGSEYSDSIRNRKAWEFAKKEILFGNETLVDRLLSTCPDFVTATNLEELASKMNELEGEEKVKPEALHASIDPYDEMLRRGKKFHNDEQLRRIAQLRNFLGDKLRTCNGQPIVDEKAMPLIAARCFILPRKTLGGIQTNLQCQVLDRQGEPIAGLFAVGEAAGFGGGGAHGLRSMEGTFLGNCILTGRTAAREIGGRI